MPARPTSTYRPTGRRSQPTPSQGRRRQRLLLAAGTAAFAVLVLVGGLLWAGRANEPSQAGPGGAAADLTGVSGQGREAAPPWPAARDPRARAELAGLPMGPMGTAEHYHPQLQITVDGRPVVVPANIGVDRATGQMSAVHTHTPDGVIHIEATRAGQTFTLGQLFTEWDVKLGPGQLGSLRAGDDGTLTVTVDGKSWTTNPALLRLAPDQSVALTYTTR